MDEFIINWHLSNNNRQRETAESIIRAIKKKHHRLVFDCAYLLRFRRKMKEIAKQRKADTYITVVLAKRLGLLLTNSAKVRICSDRNVHELNSITDTLDKLVVRSTLCIQENPKYFATSDSELIEEAKALSKYRVQGITPEKAEEILVEANGTIPN